MLRFSVNTVTRSVSFTFRVASCTPAFPMLVGSRLGAAQARLEICDSGKFAVTVCYGCFFFGLMPDPGFC